MQWFKLYAEWASDPKVQSMSEPMQRRLVMLYCLRCMGPLEDLHPPEIAMALRISLHQLTKMHALFVEKGFIDEDWSMPKFRARQGPIDPTGAEPQRRFRDRHALVTNHVTREDRISSNGRARERRQDKRRTEERGGAPSPRDITPNEPTGTDPPDPHRDAAEALVREPGRGGG